MNGPGKESLAHSFDRFGKAQIANLDVSLLSEEYVSNKKRDKKQKRTLKVRHSNAVL
jgi:hypothetical protein